jgi:hypothetical protein
MGLITYLHPREVWDSATLLWKDLTNQIFFRKQVDKIKAQGFLEQNKMRTDWLKRMYYVLNLEPETLMVGQDSAELERSRVYESVGKFQGVLADHNLYEITQVSTTRIKTSDYYAYLVVLKCRHLSTWRNFFHVISWSAIALYLVHLTVLGAHNLPQIVHTITTAITAK